MSLAAWIRLGATLVGAVALCALVWFVGPLVAVGEVRPFDAAWIRGLICAVVLLAAGGYVAWVLVERHRSIKALERELAETDEPEHDGEVLQTAMRDALATLRKSRGLRGDALYELPWYVIIGPPGSGKTTALINSGLKFPLAHGTTPEAVAGSGGTRYCDWWFTEDAVLIDTAGRYTTQDSDARTDRQSWAAFLALLKRHRPRQPVNGVLVAISLEDLVTGGEAAVTAHANAVRKRLLELHDRLGIDFPVYALFTKADLIAGFSEFFGHLPESDRRMVWGHTFQTADKTRNMIGDVPKEFDALVERTNAWLPDRLQDEPTPTARAVLFGFPSQLAAIKPQVTDFLNRIFEPSRYHANATLRGFYFTSGTQSGTPIDLLIGALSRSFGSQDVAAGAAQAGRGRSYFLNDLLKKVVIGEAGWVSTDRTAVRRSHIARLAAYAGLALLCALLVGLWWTSYLRNSQLIQQSQGLLARYRADAAEPLREPVVADRQLGRVVPLLNTLRYMPAGYATRDEAQPVLATFGLSQYGRLNSAAMTAYHDGLERLLRPRLIFRLEEQLEANRNNPSFLYEALKVYLMIGGRPEAPPDRDLVIAWMRRDWAENLFPGPGFAKGREFLEEHLKAMLDLEDGAALPVTINQSLVDDCQRTLARLSVAERAYELLKSDARTAVQRDWTALRAGGPDTALVFEAVGGDLDRVRVPFFFTYAGFYEAFIDRFGDVAEAVDRDRWVLGPAGEQQAYKAQYDSLFGNLLKLYARDFVPAWNQALARLKLRPLQSDKPRYLALQAIAAPTSPLKQILESLRDETRLTRERPAARPDDAQAKAALGQAAAGAAERAASSVLPAGAVAGAAAIARGQSRAADRFAIPTNEPLGGNIEASFRQFHVLVEGDPQRRAVDQLIQNLNEIKNAVLTALNPAEAAQANNTLITQTRSLRALASRFPPPFEPMIRQIGNEFENAANGAASSQLGQALREQVIRDCQQIVDNRYPFVRSGERETPLADFARLFGPGGILDRFFTQNLAARADRSRPQWTWRPDDPVARGLSPATLREFQRAAEIRDAFFPTGGNMPAFGFAVTPLTLSADVSKAKLEVSGSQIETQQGVNAPVTMQWPGPSGLGRAAITLEFGYGTQPLVTEKIGTWSLYRLLDTGSVLKQGDAIVATFVIGGRQLSYQINVSSLLNPLALPALRDFRCPTGI